MANTVSQPRQQKGPSPVWTVSRPSTHGSPQWRHDTAAAAVRLPEDRAGMGERSQGQLGYRRRSRRNPTVGVATAGNPALSAQNDGFVSRLSWDRHLNAD